MTIRTKLLAAAAALPLLAVLAGCAGSGTASGSGDAGTGDPVRIGVVGASDPYWETYKQAAADAGIAVDIVDFSDYAQPNPALSEGELDLNQFQHIVYLSQYNFSSGSDLVPIGATAIYPLGLYSTKYDSVADIPAGETVAVPNDESNLARGLLVLQSAGLVKLKDGGSIFATLDDIDEAGSKVKVTTLEASLTPTSLPDVAAAIINNDFVEDAGLTAADAIAEDDPSDPNALPYVNVFAARAEDADDPTYQKLVEVYQDTQSVLDGVQEASGGTAVFLKTPVDDLRASLEKVEADTRAHQG
ncbi:MetQ/NlpA family ABC transporter substrate-binding protein [Cnuibacter physcomitrellae]|uniref:MetQ/NlpA family ABC transporter substrate-binding protein n=1 Tax=Cnuibacter physcomitrellae TaxID=1619308 RepID=UPI002175D18D|nr:MetQ/NlpA family ABC transporter substrate-binding protein [Cnuibacter physcomitrellae]MCS5498634.1 MetQ/NlpA family ABC transporter substrate-binding protein [Cnuibacter physcomitrellae]